MIDFQLRRARESDFSFTEQLYLTSMEPLLSALGAWNPAESASAFAGYFNADEIEIVSANGEDVGWIQVSENDQAFCLDQIHLVEWVRGKGIGEKLIRRVINAAFEKGKFTTLSLVRGNRSIALYRRLGFRLVAEDKIKFHMQCDNPLPLKSAER